MVNKQYTANDLEAFMKIAANWQNGNHNLLENVDLKGGGHFPFADYSTDMQQYINNPAMNMYKKRERTQNWNHQEKKFLLDLCRKDMRIIENKRLDAGLTAVKNKAWKIIHQKFSSQFGTDRTCNRLKEQWRRMKACTRNEIMDYNNRLARFGSEVADRKKPSPFTFEVWEFMQEAKKACKSEALDGIDYSKLPLALEEGYEYREDEHNETEEHDMDDSSRTPPQELCDIDIKEETNETFNDTHNDSMALGDRLSASPNHSRSVGNASASGSSGGGGGGLNGGGGGTGDALDLDRSGLHSPSTHDQTASGGVYLGQNGDLAGAFQPAFNMNNISATLEALNALRSGQFPSAAAAAAAAAALQNNYVAAAHQQQQQQHQAQAQAHHHQQQISDELTPPPAKRQRTSSTAGSAHDDHSILHDRVLSPAGPNATTLSTGPLNNSTEMRCFMDMQSKEHLMRMKILEVQLQAAKYNRDLVEINKTIALQKLQEYASKR